MEIPALGTLHHARGDQRVLESQGLARYKFPERLEIVSEFAVTPSGKIQRYRLRQLVAERVAAELAGVASGQRP